MASSEKYKSSTKPSSLLWRVARFFFGACLIGGLGGGMVGAAFVIVSAVIEPNSVRIGGSNDPGGVAVLFFLAWGFAGLIVGLVVGTVGAIVIAVRR